MRAFVLTCVLGASVASLARAQAPDRWLIVPTSSTAEDAWLKPTTIRLRAELEDRRVDVWSPSEAARQFDAKGSAPAAEVSEGDIQEWVDQSSGAIRNLAEGNYSRALAQLKEAQELSRSAADELNREHDRAQRMLDTCLYMVRVLLDTNAESRANTLAHECRQLVPRVEPTKLMHPPEVLELLRKVDASRARQPRELSVDSDPSGCAVRVNGVMLGETPLELRQLLPAKYRVQVECEPARRGRVHIADVTSASSSLFVDLRFDRSIATRPLLQLRYSDPSEEKEHRHGDAAQIGKAVPASAFVLVSKAADVVEIELVDGESSSQRAFARVPADDRGPSRGDIALAVGALLDGKCMDFTGSEAVPMRCDDDETPRVAQALPAEDWPAQRPPRGQFIAGLSLASVGSAALITGYALRAPAAKAGEDWVTTIRAGASTVAAQEKWLNLNTTIIAISSVGAGTLVAAMPLVLPKRDKVPWAAWLSGGLGLGLAGFSIAWAVTADSEPAAGCSTAGLGEADAIGCVNRSDQLSWAILAGVTAAPLLTIPLVYLLRPKEKNVQANLQVRRGGGFLAVTGEF